MTNSRAFPMKILFLCSLLLGSIPCFAKSIPVYPGASLAVESEAEDQPACCDFFAEDSFDKVLSFYESALKTKPLDADKLQTRYPALKSNIDAMTQQMPPEMKIRFFILQEVVYQGNKSAELFEVVSMPEGAKFTITETQMSPKDSHFAGEFEKKLAEMSGTAMPQSASGVRLADALPSKPPAGFGPGEVTGDASGPQPTVNVQYSKTAVEDTGGEDGQGGQYVAVGITITDIGGDTEYAEAIMGTRRPDEKPVKVLEKYDGKESIEKNDYGCVGSQKVFLVRERYLVELGGDHVCDMSVLDEAIKSMNLDKLK